MTKKQSSSLDTSSAAYLDADASKPVISGFSESGISARAEEFAETCHIMTLAVSSGNIPWAAPVYYVYHEKCFWFFSSEKSRHIMDYFNNSEFSGDALASGSPESLKDSGALGFSGSLKNQVTSKKSGIAAAAVYAYPHDWQEIKGLQMQGRINVAGFSAESASAFAKYIGRFGFVKNMLAGKSVKTLSDLEKLFRVRMYVFVPDEVYYSDNSLGFGFRERVCFISHRQ